MYHSLCIIVNFISCFCRLIDNEDGEDLDENIGNPLAKKLYSAIRSKRQSGSQKQQEKIAIDLTICKESDFPDRDTSSWWVKDLNLLDSDKAVVTSGAWINCSIINASQFTMHNQFSLPHFSCQDILYGLTMNYSSVGTSFIQILHDGDRHHWLTVSNQDCDQPDTVFVYDSLFSCSSSSVRAQVACLLQTKSPSFVLKFVEMHKQDGSNDCGIFSIAYSVALCLGEQPGSFLFDQKMMRRHLLECLHNQHFSMFPIKGKRRRAFKIINSEKVKIYCDCRMPYIPNQPDMICCSKCEKWYHGNICTSPIPADAWKTHVSWYCSNCASQQQS